MPITQSEAQLTVGPRPGLRRLEPRARSRGALEMLRGRPGHDRGAVRLAGSRGLRRPVDARRQPRQVAPGAHIVVLRDLHSQPRCSIQPVDPQYAYLFNSYYNAVGERIVRDRRGLLPGRR